MPIQVGSTFAGYTIRRLLGVGGMGEVYLASHPRLDRLDALKVLPSTFTSDGEYRARFTREADVAASLWHPNIVGIHDRGEFDDHLWISMDYVAGTDAATMLENSPEGLELAIVIEIAAAIGDALDFAHQRRLLHRDVKPHNILVTDTESGRRRILLADFGIARRDDEISGLTATNMTIGTVDYAAPEQLMGDNLDGRADQYALAATAYHLLTGTKLFEHSNPAVTISKHLAAAPPNLSHKRPDLAPLDQVFNRALAKAPRDRYTSCGEFVGALATGSALSPTLLAPASKRSGAPLMPPQSAFSTARTEHSPTPPPDRQYAATKHENGQTGTTTKYLPTKSRRPWMVYSVVGASAMAVVAAAAITATLSNTGSETRSSAAGTPTSAAPVEKTSRPPLSSTAQPTTKTQTSLARPPESQSSGRYTIVEYIRDNEIRESQARRNDPKTPIVSLPVPQGWVDAGPATPEWAWGQLVYADPSMPPPPPTITAILSKLTGDVEGAKILEYAPNELKNLPDYNGGNEGQPGKLGGFDAVQVGGTYVKNGKTLLVAQKTTVIPADDGLFVLQINAEGTEEQMGPLMDATAAIDEQTTITPS